MTADLSAFDFGFVVLYSTCKSPAAYQQKKGRMQQQVEQVSL